MSEETEDPQFEELLDYLRRTRGFDFTGYKRASLIRRIGKRIHAVDVPDYAGYIDFLEVHPEEFNRLFDTILINVTAFFRDAPAWEVLAGQVIPRILSVKRADDPIRVWTAGCASGEETYTLAILLAEAVGMDGFRDRVKIYATDIDDDALSRARPASYTTKEVQGISPNFLEKYFENTGSSYVFNKELRRSVIFGRHNLIQDAPISRVDLLSCRNTLMYFNTEIQGRILDRFHFALNDRGFLLLGKAETLLTYNSSFVPVDLARRIFAKVPRNNLRDRLLVLAGAGTEEAVDHLVDHVRIREAAFNSNPVAQILVDYEGTLTMANDRARGLFQLSPSDLSRPIQDLRISYRPTDLRSSLDRAYAEKRPVIVKDVQWSHSPTAEVCFLEVNVSPLVDSNGSLLGASITFVDVTASKRLALEHERSTRELEAAYEELQSTNEELETTNEELQSTIEELETTYEELQSTNEELETMNEELQSTNEELETLNQELRDRSDELRRVNASLESILGSMQGGVVVVDRDYRVLNWNRQAEELWGLRHAEVQGKNLFSLDIGLPLEQIRPALKTCICGEAGFSELQVEATNRRGRAILCRVTCTEMKEDHVSTGCVLVMTEISPASSDDGQLATGEGGDGKARDQGVAGRLGIAEGEVRGIEHSGRDPEKSESH